MATITTSQPVSLEAQFMSTSLEEDTLECDQITLKAIEAGIPSSPESLEILHAQKEQRRQQNNYIVSRQSQQAHLPREEPAQRIQDKQTPLPTPPISRTSSSIANGSPNLSRQQTTVSILSRTESVNENSESSQTSTPRSSTISDQRQGDSLSNTITCTSLATSNAPSMKESPNIREQSLKSPTASSTIQIAFKTLLQPSRSYSIVTIDRKYYVSTDMPIPEEIMNLWQGEIKKRLEDALCRESAAAYDSEAALALEFYMAGTSNKNLKPSIMITCCSSKRKKSIKKCLGDLKWLNNSGLRYFIRVDKTFGHRMTQTNKSHIENPLVEARLASNFETLCGVSARIRDTCSANDEDAPVRFTLGGIVCTHWGPACLTAGHPFLPPPPENKARSDAASLGDEESDSVDSDFGGDDDSFCSESFDKNSEDPILYPEIIPYAQLQQVPFRPFLHRGLISDTDSPHVTRSILGDGPRPGNPDWAVFLLKRGPEFFVPNSIQLPGEDSLTFIDGIVPREELDAGSVWVAAGSGLQRGFLNSNPASVLLGDTFREAHQITLERNLAHGDSGSWVIRDHRLCGCIIAGRDSLPWAYMVPIEQVFDNMSISHATSLYTRAEIEKWRIAWEKEAHHNSSNTRGHSGVDFDRLLKPSLQPASETRNINISDREGGKPSLPREIKPESEDHPGDPEKSLLENEKASHTPGTHVSVNVKEYSTQFRCVMILFALGLSMFLTQDSLPTAVPYITDRFNSLDDVGWYYSAYLLPKAIGYIPFSIIHNSYNVKLTFIVSIAFATIGSGISSIGDSSMELIIGRTINGLGAAGIFQGAAIMLDEITHPLNKPWILASLGLLNAVVFGSGPIITGSIIDKVLWKWIFYINIPMGVAVVIAILLFFDVPNREAAAPPHYRRRPLYFGATLFSSKCAGRLSYIVATVFLTIFIIDALLAINWGGRKHFPLSFISSVIGILTGVFIVSIFISLRCYSMAYKNAPDDCWKFIVPLRIFRNRSLVSGMVFAVPINSGFWILLYYLPIWFQAVKGASPLKSSVMNLGCLFGYIVATFLSGVFVTITGYCPPYMIASSAIASIGVGFMTTFTVTTSHYKWIGLQILAGLGVGLGLAIPSYAIQASLPAKDLKTATAVLLCAQTLAAAIFASVAQSIFVNKLMSGIKVNLPHVDSTVVLRSGILNLKFAEGIEEGVLPGIYNKALVDVFYLATALIAFSIFGALSDEWRSVKSRPYADGARVKNEEDLARRIHPWSVLWTYTSNIFSKLWDVLTPLPQQRHTEERISSPGQQMKQSTVQVPKPILALLHSECIPAKELDNNEVHELPGVEPVGMELYTPRSGTRESPEEWSLPLQSLPLLFATAEPRDERTEQSESPKRETFYMG